MAGVIDTLRSELLRSVCSFDDNLKGRRCSETFIAVQQLLPSCKANTPLFRPHHYLHDHFL